MGVAIHGHCQGRFEAVKKLLQTHLESGEELGASIVVNIDGNDVVDLWGGYKDRDHSEPWAEDTIVNVFSMTKTVLSFALLLLATRNQLKLTDKVAKYWPEFAVNGKQDIEIRHIMSHTSGLSGWDQPLTTEDLVNVPKLTGLLAQQKPWWEPGTASGYQALTSGYLAGEVVRRVSGKSLKSFVAEEIAGPLGADFQLGCQARDEPRRSDIFPPPTLEFPPTQPGSIMAKTFSNPPMELEFVNSLEFRMAEIGSGNGHTNARGINRIMSVISRHGLATDGREFLSEGTIDQIFQVQAYGRDHVLDVGLPIRWGTGFALPSAETYVNWIPSGRVCTWGGFGGSIVIMDLDRKMTISYAMNKLEMTFVGSARTKAYVAAIYDALGVSRA
jgi:CubicO group peptidase (beta-lactamase class C family)